MVYVDDAPPLLNALQQLAPHLLAHLLVFFLGQVGLDIDGLYLVAKQLDARGANTLSNGLKRGKHLWKLIILSNHIIYHHLKLHPSTHAQPFHNPRAKNSPFSCIFKGMPRVELHLRSYYPEPPRQFRVMLSQGVFPTISGILVGFWTWC